MKTQNSKLKVQNHSLKLKTSFNYKKEEKVLRFLVVALSFEF